MPRHFAILLAVLSFSVSLFGQRDGDPENWCRGGSFPMDSEEFKIGTAVGVKWLKINFYNDRHDECPASEKCKDKAYILPGNKVIVSRTYKNFACSWYVPAKGMPTTGWIKLDDLKIKAADPQPKLSAWFGKWTYGENAIMLTNNKLAGYLKVKGEAYWQGLGNNIHIGELDDRVQPKGNLAKIGETSGDEYACRVTMRLIDSFLVVKDNLNCGGVNVTFSGVYRKGK